MIYNPADNFVYVSDGATWDKISGVNNPVDNLLPITQNRVPRWAEDFPPGGAYSGVVLQDSALEIDRAGNAILMDAEEDLTTFPWKRGNFLANGSLVSGYCVGRSLDETDPTAFTPVVTQLPGKLGNRN